MAADAPGGNSPKGMRKNANYLYIHILHITGHPVCRKIMSKTRNVSLCLLYTLSICRTRVSVVIFFSSLLRFILKSGSQRRIWSCGQMSQQGRAQFSAPSVEAEVPGSRRELQLPPLRVANAARQRRICHGLGDGTADPNVSHVSCRRSVSACCLPTGAWGGMQVLRGKMLHVSYTRGRKMIPHLKWVLPVTAAKSHLSVPTAGVSKQLLTC